MYLVIWRRFSHSLRSYIYLGVVLYAHILYMVCNLYCYDILGIWIITLMQDGRPLAFTRKQLLERHLGQSAYVKEMLAILHAMDL
jgi:hypothetical protein